MIPKLKSVLGQCTATNKNLEAGWKKIEKRASINDVRHLLVIFDLPTYHVRQHLHEIQFTFGDFFWTP